MLRGYNWDGIGWFSSAVPSTSTQSSYHPMASSSSASTRRSWAISGQRGRCSPQRRATSPMVFNPEEWAASRSDLLEPYPTAQDFFNMLDTSNPTNDFPHLHRGDFVRASARVTRRKLERVSGSSLVLPLFLIVHF